MKPIAHLNPVVLEATDLAVNTPAGRPLLRGLSISLTSESVAIVGRNGVGKSTLLGVLAGLARPHRGVVVSHTERLLVPQTLPMDPAGPLRRLYDCACLTAELTRAGLPTEEALRHARGFSLGELRKLYLLAAKLQRPGLLLVDEPTEDLDAMGISWLVEWLTERTGPTLVVTHNKQLLRAFEHFFVVQESGCRYFHGTFDSLRQDFERQSTEAQRKYLRNINVLLQREQHNARVCRRRQRKKNLGRIHETGRSPSRAKLNSKRSYAQESQGRAAKIRKERIGAVREWTKSTRRALSINLPMVLGVPALPEGDGEPIIELRSVGTTIDERVLFANVDLALARERVAIIGPNGSGKTTLLEVMLGHRDPTSGVSRPQLHRLGSIAQGATDWMSEASLLTHLITFSDETSPDALAELLINHKFPLALAERPLCSLSPGERTRAALLCLFQRSPTPEMLVLDEPTYSLDFVGAAAVEHALSVWPGGLVVVSHDDEFLRGIGVERRVRLGHHRTLRV